MWVPTAAFAALPALDAPHRTPASAPGDAAVVVGVEDYFVLPDVPYAQRDAELFYDFAVYTRGIPTDRVTLLTGPVSREKVVAALEAAGRSTRAGGTVWVYFAGHGAASPTSGERLLVGADAQADLDTFQARAVSVADVKRWATAGGGSAVLLLDTCYSGRSRSGASVVEGKRFAVPSYAAAATPKVVEWTAAGPDQWSGPLDAARHGAFTYLAVGALRGWADGQRDGVRDGRVTVEEASLYVEEGLRTLQLRDQRPERVGDGAVVLSTGSEAAPELSPALAAAAPAPAGGATPVAYGTGNGQIQLATAALVNVYLDGVLHLRNPSAGGVVRVDDVTPGTHLLEVKNGLGKVVASSSIEVAPGTQVRLRYQDRALSDLGRGPVDTKPLPAYDAGVPVLGNPVVDRIAGTIDTIADLASDTLPGPAPRDPIGAHLTVLGQIPWADDQVEYLRTVAQRERFTCAQAGRLVAQIPFSAQRIEGARALRPAITDPENVGALLSVFSFASEREEVRALFAR